MKTLVVATLVVVCASGARAQPTVAPAVVHGRLVYVSDAQTGKPIAGAQVRDSTSGASGVTTAFGMVQLSFADTAGAMLSIRKIGYEPRTLTVDGAQRDTARLAVLLKQRSLVMTRHGFDERLSEGLGFFVTEGQLRSRRGAWLSEVIPRHVPGVSLTRGPGGVVNLAARNADAGTRRACLVSVYLDGVLLFARTQPGPPPAPDFGSMQADRYAGVEFYPADSSPPTKDEDTDAGCGKVLLWMR